MNLWGIRPFCSIWFVTTQAVCMSLCPPSHSISLPREEKAFISINLKWAPSAAKGEFVLGKNTFLERWKRLANQEILFFLSKHFSHFSWAQEVTGTSTPDQGSKGRVTSRVISIPRGVFNCEIISHFSLQIFMLESRFSYSSENISRAFMSSLVPAPEMTPSSVPGPGALSFKKLNKHVIEWEFLMTMESLTL